MHASSVRLHIHEVIFTCERLEAILTRESGVSACESGL